MFLRTELWEVHKIHETSGDAYTAKQLHRTSECSSTIGKSPIIFASGCKIIHYIFFLSHARVAFFFYLPALLAFSLSHRRGNVYLHLESLIQQTNNLCFKLLACNLSLVSQLTTCAIKSQKLRTVQQLQRTSEPFSRLDYHNFL